MSATPTPSVTRWHFGFDVIPVVLLGAPPCVCGLSLSPATPFAGTATTLHDFFVLPARLRCQECEVVICALGLVLLEAT